MPRNQSGRGSARNILVVTRLPNFFIAGAPKAGTDALYYELDQHPAVYMSPLKEPCHFAAEVRAENFEPALRAMMLQRAEETLRYVRGPLTERRFGGVVPEWDDYLRLFAGARGETAVGECSVCYLWSKSAAQSIASRIPEAKIIIVLMDPAERAFAQYRKSVLDGTVSYPFTEHLKRAFARSGDELGVLHPFLDFGLYTEQVRRFLSIFPQQQLHISLYEESQRDFRTWFSGILGFLGVDAAFAPRRHKPGFRARLQKLHGGMKPVERVALVDYYREDIQKLSPLIKRDLSAWLRV